MSEVVAEWCIDPGRHVVDGREQVTELLLAARNGQREALDSLMPLVYEELRRVAHNRLQGEPAGHSLDTTALVHETYMRLVNQTRVEWRDRTHFFAVASTLMRRFLVDYARRRRAVKRGGDRLRVSLDPEALSFEYEIDRVLVLDDALRRLAAVDERLARVVECRFFGGLTEEETAAALDLTTRTVQRDWSKAKALLHEELSVA